MVSGIDYGTISITSKRTGKTYTSKPTLFKPGAEKFCSLFRIRAEYSKDMETWEMLGSQSGTVAYICRLYNSDILVGEGRGVCTVNEKDGSANNAVKIAKKRAKLDAVLETGGLSEFFTQDLEDVEPMQPKQGSKSPKTDMVKEAKQMIETAHSTDNLILIAERIEKSPHFTPQQKTELNKTISLKVDANENKN